ncbi:MAG TPA: hypothetical protein VNV82_19685 [Bryobacteraceae bacterium]|jgi:hypothetical protein|nr:hypothetical protein [Bryobacteraceae bacterium]
MMKKILVLAIATVSGLHAQGVVRQTVSQLGTTTSYVVAFNWTGDPTLGTVAITPAALANNLSGYFVTQVETAPLSPAPTSGYAVQILDSAGVDILAGSATSLSATSAQSFASACVAPPINGNISLSISGQSVAGARGVVYVFIQPSCVNGGANTSAAVLTSAGPPSNPCLTLGALDINTVNGALYSCPTAGGSWVLATGGSAAWGAITGTLSSQTDLQTALNSKATAPQITHLGTITAGSALTATSNSFSSWDMTLSGAGGYSFSMSGQASGQLIAFNITQDATGFRAITLPTGFNTTIPFTSMGPNVTANLLYRWNGATADLLSATLASGPSFGSCQTAPAYNPSSGNYLSWFDCTDLTIEAKNAAGTVYKLGSGATVSGYYTTIGASKYCGSPLQVCAPASGLTILNTAGSSAINSTGGTQVLQSAAVSTDNLVMAGGAISGSNTTGTIAVNCFEFPGTGQANWPRCGVALRESGTGNMVVFDIVAQFVSPTSAAEVKIEKWGSQTSFGGTISGAPNGALGSTFWAKFSCSVAGCQSGNVTLQASSDGVNYSAGYTATAATNFTTGPNQWGVFGSPASTSDAMYVPILSYTIQ